MNSVKDGHCPKQIKRKNKQKKGRNEPQPPIASSSSRWYLPPKVKSVLQLGVETETGEKRMKRGRMKGNAAQLTTWDRYKWHKSCSSKEG